MSLPSPAASAGGSESAAAPDPANLTTVGSSTASLLGIEDDIAIIELSGNYDRNTAAGEPNEEPRQAVAQELYAERADEFDFLIVFTTFAFDLGESTSGDVLAFHTGVQNAVSGIGLPLFDSTALYGSGGRLQGYVDMAAIAGWVTDPLDPEFDRVIEVLGHEVMHQWCCHVAAGGRPLLGIDGSHWSFLLDTDASVMFGNDWRDNGDGSFTSVAAGRFYSPLDLYLAGFLEPDEVPPMTLLANPAVDPERLPQVGATVTATPELVTIDEIVTTNGPRAPPASESQQDFRAAFVLVVPQGQSAPPEAVAAVGRVRAAFSTRFSILTGGRALFRTRPSSSTEPLPGTPSPVDGGPTRTGDAVLLDALAWLRSRQQADGSWADTAATRLRDTVVTLDALARLDPFFTRGDEAAAFLSSQPILNTDFLARRTGSLASSGGGDPVAIDQLLSEQNDDGGWGLGPGYGSDPLDTALALRALTSTTDLPPGVAENGVAYLLAAQQANGSWSNVAGGPGRTATTAAAIRALRSAGAHSAAVSAAAAWLATRQNPDGGFGDSPSTAHDTANVLGALIEAGALDAIDAGLATSFLTSRQTVAGSWEGSTYTTSLVVDAVKRLSFPNLTFLGPILASPPRPFDGERVELTLTLANDGNAVAAPTLLRIFDGDPDAGGLPALADLAVPELAPRQMLTLRPLWESQDQTGLHTLVAVLDAAGTLDELSELDNRGSVEIEVLAPSAEPDLEVTSADTSVVPAVPVELPTQLAISVVVRNNGLADATAVTTRLWLGEPDLGTLLTEETITVVGRSSTGLNFSVPLTVPGTTLFTFEIDPDNLLIEANEDNNRVQIAVTPEPNVDLEVTAADIVLEGTPSLGEDVTFRVTLRNRGTLDVANATAAFLLREGATTQELLRTSFPLAAGTATERTVPWRVDREASLTFLVQFDPDNLVPERLEDNNNAQLDFTAGAVALVNLRLENQGLGFAPDPALEGSPLQISAQVTNVGGQIADPVDVAFYQGNPAQGGLLLGQVRLAAPLASGASATALFDLAEVEGSAERFIFAVADPDNLLLEFAEDDNEAFAELTVASLPDLAISPAALSLVPAFPRPSEPVALSVAVANLGEQGSVAVPVRAFDGDPDFGGVLLAEETLAAVAGGSSGVATLSWVVAAAASAFDLVVRVDPDNLLREQQEENNEARLAVVVDDGTSFVSERHFSPNGDGIKETTLFVFRLDQARTVRVEVVDRRSEEIVRVGAEQIDVASGTFEWDGRDDLGRIARDGDYTLRVVDAAGSVIETAVATLDTNRSSLIEALGTPFENDVNLTCRLDTVNDLQLTEDESLAFFWGFHSVGRVGPFRMPTGSEMPQSLSPPGWVDDNGVRRLVITPDGSRFAVKANDRLSGLRGSVWVANGDGSSFVEVPGSTIYDPIGFAADGEPVAFDCPSVARLPVDGVTPPVEILGSTSCLEPAFGDFFEGYGASLSPDGTRLLMREDVGNNPVHLINLETASSSVVPGGESNNDEGAWSADSSRFVLPVSSAQRLDIFDRNGTLLDSASVPAEPSAFQLSRLEADFSTDGRELAVVASQLVDGPEGCGSVDVLLVYDSLIRTWQRIGRSESLFGCESYTVSTFDGSVWQERGKLHYGLHYQKQSVELAPFLPDASGRYRVRIQQSGHEAAHIDAVVLQAGPQTLLPDAAVRVIGGAAVGDDVTETVRHGDAEVVDAHEATFELSWSEVPAGRVRLLLEAREETLSLRNARPLRYPKGVDAFFDFVVTAGDPMSIDGLQTAHDQLGEPLFQTFSRTDTGHPSAVVSGWVQSDGAHLYAALDFTVDNTLDANADWGALYVETAGGWQPFRVSAAETTYGTAGFIHTGRVHHRHKYYEFKVPLAELDAAEGDSLRLRFEAYGTAALLDGQSDLLPPPADVLWVPNERALLIENRLLGQPSVVILLDEENRRLPLFEDWNRVENFRFSPIGRRLLFESRDPRLDPQSPCFQLGDDDTLFLRSLLNLSADLRALRQPSTGAVVLEGTAADRNFDRFELEFSTSAAPESFQAIAPPSGRQILDDRLALWVPPGPGTYLVRLTSHDLAGNSRSDIARVSSPDTPSLTDVFIDPALISPNGDGFRDQLQIHYRVLEPVTLEFRFYDDAGDRVRTITRSHGLAGSEHDLFWDGRDDAGLPVPDGDYRVEVQGYEFFFAIDVTPPAVLVFLSDAYRSSIDGRVEVKPSFSFDVRDAGLELGEIGAVERGAGPAPAIWELVAPILFDGDLSADVPPREQTDGSFDLSLSQFVDWRFRAVAEDAAGNVSIATTLLGNEQLMLEALGPHRFDPSTGGLEPLLPAPFAPLEAADGAPEVVDSPSVPLRILIAETIRSEISQLFVQFRPLAASEWLETPITEFLEPGSVVPGIEVPDHRLEIVWDLAGIDSSLVTVVRLHAIDFTATDHFSNAIRLAPAGGAVKFLGTLTGPNEIVDPLLTDTGLDPTIDSLLWGVETLPQELGSATLLLQSDVDQRYVVEQAIAATAIADGVFLFEAPLLPCVAYTGVVVGETLLFTDPDSGEIFPPQPVESLPEIFVSKCFTLKVEPLLPKAEELSCGAIPQRLDELSVELTPTRLDGPDLRLLTLGRELADGTESILFSVNQPQSGLKYTATIDTSLLPEGRHHFVARLSNLDDVERTERLQLPVDRTPPADVRITLPLDLQPTCGDVRVEGRIEDNVGFEYALFVGAAGGPVDFEVAATDRFIAGQRRPPFPDTLIAGELHEGIGGLLGETILRLEVTDAAGFKVCGERTFFADGVVEGAQVTVSGFGLEVDGGDVHQLMSPNDDGSFDQADILLSSAETTFANVEIRGAEHFLSFGLAQCVATAASVRFLADAVPVSPEALLVWDGRDDGGVVVQDGAYAVVANLEDACGNRVERVFCDLFVDTTPPEATLTFPQGGDPLPLIVEVRGATGDTVQSGSVPFSHFQEFRLEFGLGTNPQTWALVNSATRPVGPANDNFLGAWNTFGLAGDVTLRLTATDVVDNAAEVRVPLVLAGAFQLISDYGSSPRLFSPNGDGRRETTALRFFLEDEADVDLTISSESGVSVRTLLANARRPAGASIEVWGGNDDASAPLPDGLYVAELSARLASNPAVNQTETITLLLDRTPPLVELLSPSGGFASSGIGVVGTIEDPHLVSYVVSLSDTPQAPVWQEIGRGTTSVVGAALASLADLAEGDYALRIEAADAGEIRVDRVFPFAVDNTPPQVSLTTPPSGTFLGAVQGPAAVLGTVVEDHPQSFRVEFGAGNEPTSWSLLIEGSGLPVSENLAHWDVSGLADGVYSLRLVATDLAGLESETRTLVTVDNTPPIALLVAPAENSFVTGPSQILGTATDDNLSRYTVAIAPGPATTATLFSDLGGGVGAVADGLLLDWVALPPDGPHTLRLVVEDLAGNGAEVRRTVEVDLTPPAAPQDLVAEIEGNDVRLTWSANAETDLAGYHVTRDGVRITATAVPAPTFLDPDPGEGAFTYTVLAIDRADLESPPSSAASIAIDRTPPAVGLTSPIGGARVSGLVDVVGTASSQDDFKEYRLSVEPLGDPAARARLRTSPVSQIGELLGQWSTLGAADDVEFRLLLEAEDLSGNVGSVAVTVTVDNLPPAQPTGLQATVTGDDVALSWTANGESDLRGYLLFRDGRLANATGVVVGDLAPLAISGTQYDDLDRPDGTFSYEVVAIDLAGNLSDPAAPASATVETRAPQAVLVQPADGESFEDSTFLLAESQDTDVAEVLFQYRAAGTTPWTDIGTDVALPFGIQWDATPLTFGDYELRAVGTDTSAKTDTNPATITVTVTDLTRPDPIVGLTALVDGGDVTLSFGASGSLDVVGYHVERQNLSGTPVRLTTTPTPETTYTDTAVADGDYLYTVLAVDGVGNESDPSDPVSALVHTPVVRQPLTPTSALLTDLQGTVPAGHTVEVTLVNALGTVPLPDTVAAADGSFAHAGVAIERGGNTFTVTTTYGAGNRSKPTSVVVLSATLPSAPLNPALSAIGFDVTFTWDQNAPLESVIGYRPFRAGTPLLADQPFSDFTLLDATSQTSSFNGPDKAVDGFGSTYWAPIVHVDQPVAGQWWSGQWNGSRGIVRVEVDWFEDFDEQDNLSVFGAADFDLEAWNGQVWVPVVAVRGNAEKSLSLELPHAYRTDRLRLLLLSAMRPETAFEPIRLAEVRPVEQPITPSLTIAETVPDGIHLYTVTAVSDLGLEGPPSAGVEISVGDVVPPDPVVLSAVVTGADVSLSWTASPSADVTAYQVSRDGAVIANVVGVDNRTYLDAGLANDTYLHTVTAVDGAGNPSVPSNGVTAVVAVTPPTAPVSLAVVDAGPDFLELTWAAGPGPAPALYRLLRSTVSGGPYEEVVATTATSHRDQGLSLVVTYFYVVVAVDSFTNASPFSNEASGTTVELLAAPVLHHPAFAGRPFETGQVAVTLAGSSLPGAAVELFSGGQTGGQRLGVATARSAADTVLLDRVVHFRSRLSGSGRFLLNADPFAPEVFDFLTDVWSPIAIVEPRQPRWLPDSSGFFYVQSSANVRRFSLSDQSDVEIATADFIEVAVPMPDGLSFLAVAQRSGTNGIWRYDLDAASWSLLLALGFDGIEPDTFVVSPDGSRVAYLRFSDGDSLELFEIETGSITVVDATSPDFAPPSWAPDSSGLVHASFAGAGEVRRFDLATGNTTILVAGGFPQFPQWSADGSQVAYTVDPGELRFLDLATGSSTTVRQINDFTDALQWVSSGHLLLSDGGLPRRIEPAGRFEVTNVSLEPGDNLFSAIATSVNGGMTPESDIVTVTLRRSSLPDLEVTDADVVALPEAARPGDTVRISVTVRNAGSGPAPAAELTLVVQGPTGLVEPLADRAPLSALAPGGRQTVLRDFIPPSTEGRYLIFAVVDPVELVLEADEANNRGEAELRVVPDGTPTLAISTDRSEYADGDTVLGIAELFNGGDPFSGRLTIVVEDREGVEVEALLDLAIADLPFAQTLTRNVSWPTGGIFAGDYQLHAQLLDDLGSVVAGDASPFRVGDRVELAASVATDRARYERPDRPLLSGVIDYLAGNAAVSDATATLRVLDPADVLLAEFVQPLGTLLPGSTAQVTAAWDSGPQPAGIYRVVLDVSRGGTTAVQALTMFELADGPARVEGSLDPPIGSRPAGEPLTVGFTANNVGGTAVAGVDLRVTLRTTDLEGSLDLQTVLVDLAAGASSTGTLVFATDTLSLGTYPLVFEADVPLDDPGGGFERLLLDVASVTLVDAEPPELLVLEPSAGQFLGADPAVLVRASDRLSAVDLVEVQLDAGAPLVATLDDLFADEYLLLLAGVADGPHTVVARAVDSFGNEAVTSAIPFILDTVPPLIQISGVVDGQIGTDPVVPVVDVADANLASATTTLNGAPFVSGTTVEDPAIYVLTVVAEDLAGNLAQLSVTFTIEEALPFVTIDAPADNASIDFPTADVTGTTNPGVTVTLTTSPGGVSLTTTADAAGAYLFAQVPLLFGSNTLTVQAGDTTGPTASVTVVRPAPSLAATKTAALAVDADANLAVSPGDTLRYTLTVSNQGSGSAFELVISDPTPAHTAIVPGSVSTTSGVAVSESPVEVSVDALAGGSTVTILFDVVIADPLPVGVIEIVNQGSLSAAELPALLTDDPAVAGTADPTATAVLVPVALTIDDVTIDEGDTGTTDAQFTVHLSAPNGFEVTVDFATVAGTAEENVDYQATAGTLTLPPGTTEAQIAVPVIGDLLLEPDEETFVVELTNPVSASLADASATGTIVDDELCAGPNLLANPGAEEPLTGAVWRSVTTKWEQRFSNPDPFEGHAYFFSGAVASAELQQDVDVSLFGALIDAGTLRFEFEGFVRTFDEVPADSARIIVEYRDSRNAVVLDSFDSGETSSPFEWQQVTDTRVAPVFTRFIRVRLLATRWSGTDNDGYFDGLSLRTLRTPLLSIADASVLEPDVPLVKVVHIPVSLSCETSEIVHATATTTHKGTATAGQDYTPLVDFPVVFGMGSDSVFVQLEVLGDNQPEGDEDLTIEIASADAVIFDGEATVTIVDNDSGGCPIVAAGRFFGSQCAGSEARVTVFNQAELDAYLIGHGFDGTHFKSVTVAFNPSGSVVIDSPCEVILAGAAGYLDVVANRVCIYGRTGVSVGSGSPDPGQGIAAGTIHLVSEEGGAGFSDGLAVVADSIDVWAREEAKIGLDSMVTVTGPLSVVSTGDVPTSDALIRQGSVVSAGELLLSASRAATIGKFTDIDVGGQCTVTSTGSVSGSVAKVSQGAFVDAASFDLTSGNKAVLGPSSATTVTGTFLMDAAGICTIDGSATISAAVTTGSCFGK